MTPSITGSVLPDGLCAITLRVRGSNGQVAQVQAAIDTGFNDYLTLPPWAIARLELPPSGETVYGLADGTHASTRRFLAEVEWLGAWRRVFVVAVDADALVGTRLMQGCVLTIEMIDGGRVEIRPLG
jgi:clan AA aspartic protease